MRHHVLDLAHELLLAFSLEHDDFDLAHIVITGKIWTVVSIFKNEFELVEVAATLELVIVLLFQESLPHGSDQGLCVS